MRLFSFLKSWSLLRRTCFVLILALFWAQGAWFSWKHGPHVYDPTDGTSEGITIFAARHYVEHGFFQHHLIPTYPPFGEDLEGHPRSEPFLYNHYLPGQDWVLGLWIRIFGDQNLGLARLIPHTLTTLAFALLSLALGWTWGSSALSFGVLATLLAPRALSVWSTCLWGHSHGTAFALLSLAWFVTSLGRWKPAGRGGEPKAWGATNWITLGCISGISVSFFAIDWVPLLGFALLSLGLQLHPQGGKAGFWAGFGVALGLVFALCYQLSVSVLEFGSWQAVWGDVEKWMTLRAYQSSTIGAQLAGHHVNHPWHRVLREFNRQGYGATGFTSYQIMLLALGALAMAWRSSRDSDRNALFWRGTASIFCAWLASFVWPLVMKNHAMSNLHFVHRHTAMVFLLCSWIVLSTCYKLVERLRSHT